MPEELVIAVVGLVVIGFVVGLMVWALAMQKKGLTKQQQAMGSIEESLALARRGLNFQSAVSSLLSSL